MSAPLRMRHAVGDGPPAAGKTPLAHRHAMRNAACRACHAACPQILLASMWIACAYRNQALDPKDFVRAASNRAGRPAQRLPHAIAALAARWARPMAGLSTIFVGKDVDILSMRDLSR
ncbi:hypothetical protein ACVK00_001684 [Burkholderia sp. PvR073]|uniref:hypothetical protein n=1 Tax=Burkholderia TaxID=32008 RepID=UPI00254B45FE|nr:hypothetical protein [Burkholderia sp. lyk4-R2A-23]